MNKKSYFLFVGVVFFLVRASGADLVQYVNPFIGTQVGSGNTYPARRCRSA